MYCVKTIELYFYTGSTLNDLSIFANTVSSSSMVTLPYGS